MPYCEIVCAIMKVRRNILYSALVTMMCLYPKKLGLLVYKFLFDEFRSLGLFVFFYMFSLDYSFFLHLFSLFFIFFFITNFLVSKRGCTLYMPLITRA